ncbi:MAG: hypothetical protein ABW321_31435 [Polyangiales bacterium]
MSDKSSREQAIHEIFDRGDIEAAATASLQLYRQEIFSFLHSRLRSASDAEEVFSMFGEDLIVGIPKFQWRCSLRSWCYTLAHHAVIRYSTSPHRKAGRNIRLSSPGVATDLIEQNRSMTKPYLRTEVKDKFRALRSELDDADQLLLNLHVDRGLSFREIGITLAGDANLDDTTLAREEVRLRKQYSRLRVQFRKLAEQNGLLPPKES